MNKRFLSIILVLAMVFSIASFAAAADETGLKKTALSDTASIEVSKTENDAAAFYYVVIDK